jgi:hypothetical protein
MSSCFRCDKKSSSVKTSTATETTNTKPLPTDIQQGSYTVHDDCGCTMTVIVDEDGNVTIVNTPDPNDPNTTPDKPADLVDSVWDYISKWVENADIFDWLKLIATAAGIAWYGYQLLSQLFDDGTDPNGGRNRGFNGSPVYTGPYTPPKLKDVVESLCLFAEVNYDVSELSNETVEFTIGNNTSARTMIDQLSKVYNFDIIQSSGVLKFRHRYSNDVADATIPTSDMGFGPSIDNLPDRITTKRLQGIDLPKSISLTYFSGDTAQQPFSQIAKLPAYVEGQNISLNVPITLSHQKAKDAVEMLLMAAHIEKSTYKFNTSYKYIHIEPGDILFNPEVGNLRVTKIREGVEGILEFEATAAGIEDSLAAAGLPPQLPDNAVTNPDALVTGSVTTKTGAIFIDPPYIEGESSSTARIYAVVHGYGNAGWTGGRIYLSKDDGTTYSSAASVNTEATWGVASAALAGYSQFGTLDLASSISVTLKTGSLTSVTDVELNNGSNMAYIGRELICFGVATLTGEKTYTLSRLRRGLSGTAQFANQHTSDEIFVMKDSLTAINLSDKDIGKTLKFKAVTMGADISNVDAVEVGIQSNNYKLYQPKNGGFTVSGTTHKFTWEENIRIPNSLNPVAVLHDIDWTSYAIGVYDTNGNLKAKRVITTNTWDYTSTMKVADFGSLPNNFSISVVPISMKNGNGYPLTISV